jgi:glycolate oxidase subunit GlcD
VAQHVHNSYHPVDAAVLKRLREIFPKDRISNEPVDLMTYSYDATRKEYAPQVVIWPETAQEISDLMKVACNYRLPVYPRGGGTGLTGGALAVEGGIVLSLERMVKIGEIDEQNRLVTAQCGIPLAELKTAVQKKNLFYPPDPSSAKSATLGGTLAECAGGLNCVKYGTTKDWVMSAVAVMPTGEIIHVGSKARKSVVGYNLLQLLIGSEGTLAILTDATLRLIPYPKFRKSFYALYDSVMASAIAVQAMLQSGVTPSALEFIDRISLEAANNYVKDKQIPVAEALLLVETDGYDEQSMNEDLQILLELCKEKSASAIREAQTEEERASLWFIRKSLSPAMYAMAAFKANEDICVPISEFPAMLEEAYAISKRHNVITLCFGHAGDGNLHVNFMSNQEHDDDVEAAVNDLFRATVAHGGSISGEHGIGITKAPYLSYEMGERELRLLVQIKELFDPVGILNPSKIVMKKE